MWLMQQVVVEVVLAVRVAVLAVLVLAAVWGLGGWERCSQPQLWIKIRSATATV